MSLFIPLCLCVHVCVCVCMSSSVQACMHNRVRLYSIHVWANGAMTILKSRLNENKEKETQVEIENHSTASTSFTKTHSSREVHVSRWEDMTEGRPPTTKHKLDIDLIFKSNCDTAWQHWQLHGIVFPSQRGNKHQQTSNRAEKLLIMTPNC